MEEKSNIAECSVDKCNRPVRALSYCQAHYERVKKGSGLKPDKPLRKFAETITDDQLRDAVKLAKKLARCSQSSGVRHHVWRKKAHSKSG